MESLFALLTLAAGLAVIMLAGGAIGTAWHFAAEWLDARADRKRAERMAVIRRRQSIAYRGRRAA